MAEQRLAWIATVYSLPEASCLITFLRSGGIPASATHQALATLNPTWITALGGVRVFVPTSSLEDALTLLAEHDNGWVKPPRSYADNLLLNVLLALALAFFGVVPPPRVAGFYRWRVPVATS